MAEWHSTPVLGSFVVRADVSMPSDLQTLHRQVSVQVADRLGDQRARAAANARAALGVEVLTPLNGRSNGAAIQNARAARLAAARESWRDEQHARCDDWAYYSPREIERRVQRAAERAILHECLTIAGEHGVDALPRSRHLLQQAGHLAAQAHWRDELSAAYKRLRTGESGSRGDDDGVDVSHLRRRLEDLAHAAVSVHEGS